MAANLLKKLPIPPRQMKSLPGAMDLSGELTVMAASRSSAGALTGEPRCKHVLLSGKLGGHRAIVSTTGNISPEHINWPTAPQKGEGFAIRCDKNAIAIDAFDAAGLRWAVNTAASILKLAGKRLPCFALSDWPELKLRAVMVDLSRSCVEKPAYIRQVIDCLSQYRCNMLQLYFEQRLNLRKHPLLKHPLGYSLRQVSELSRYASARGITLAPAMASFGHMQGFLQHQQYRHMADGDQIYQINPLSGDARQLLSDMYDDWASIASGGYVNAGCDEAPYYGQCKKTASYIAKNGVDKFLAGHLGYIHKQLTKRGFKMMIWADMLKTHPAVMDMLAKDITLLEWNYGRVDATTEKQIDIYRNKGFHVIAAPAASRSGQMHAPTAAQISHNIPTFTALANKMSLAGVMCCQWECSPRSPQLSLPGFALSAAMAWRGTRTNSPAMRKAIYENLCHADGTKVDALCKKLSPDAMLRRFSKIQYDPARVKSYHLITHETIASDPLIYLRPRAASGWAKSLTRQYEDCQKLLTQVSSKSPQWQAVWQFAADCGQWSASRRTLIAEAAALMGQAKKSLPADRDQAVEQLSDAREKIKKLSQLTKKISLAAKPVWTLARYDSDPVFDQIYAKPIAVTASATDKLIDRLSSCIGEVKSGGDFTLLDDYLTTRRAVVFKISLGDVEQVNVLNLDIFCSYRLKPEYLWKFDRRIEAFQPPNSRYDYMYMPAGRLASAIKAVRTRTQSPWNLQTGAKLEIYRPLAIGESPRKFASCDNINTDEYFLTPVTNLRYELVEINGDEAIWHLHRAS